VLGGHGTHVAHTAAGANGVASSASIVAIQVFHPWWDSQKQVWIPKTFDSDWIQALDYTYNTLRFYYKIAAVNLSLGGGAYSGYCDNVNNSTAAAAYWMYNLKLQNIATVVSSGNENWSAYIGFPACVSHAISVGNTTYDTSQGKYDAVFAGVDIGSNSNATLDLLAPGTDVCSAFPVFLDTQDNAKDGINCAFIGTSMAAPHVAGAIAVLKAFRPGATVDQEVNALWYSGSNVYDSRNGVTRPRINVYAALFKI
jgi:subtilisin family serine protease